MISLQESCRRISECLVRMGYLPPHYSEPHESAMQKIMVAVEDMEKKLSPSQENSKSWDK